MKNFTFPILMRSIITGVCVVTFFINGSCQIKYNGSINTGTDASAINYQTQGTGAYSFASGYQSVASGHTSTALGYKATAMGIRSFAIGENTYSASQGYSFGQQAKANSSQSLAIGRFVESNATGTIVIGSSSDGYSLINNIPNSLMIGFNSNIPTLFVGPSANFTSIGKVGIGTTIPQSTLHIVGDATISTLANKTGRGILSTDATGMLILADYSLIGDNMGNCEATRNLKMSDYSIFNGSIGDKVLQRADGSLFNNGLRFNTNNSMVLETGLAATMSLVSGSNTPSAIWVSNWTSGGYGLVLNDDNRTGGIYRDANNPSLAIGFNSTKVGIGVIPPADGDYALYVAGGILATEVRVQLQSDWKDLVFKPEYKLRSLTEVETFISKNGHLPEIPTSETVKKEGINIGDMNALLLQKIEELTLYILQQQKQIDTQQSEINSIKSNLNR
ncbi:MAG: hypothetical protein WCI92_06560 [Bacteroidota bacterium]